MKEKQTERIKFYNRKKNKIKIDKDIDTLKLFCDEQPEQLYKNGRFSKMLTTFKFKDKGGHNDLTVTQTIRNIKKSHNLIPDVYMENSKNLALFSKYVNNKVIERYESNNNNETVYLINSHMYYSFDIRAKYITSYYTFKFNKKDKTYHFYPNAYKNDNGVNVLMDKCAISMDMDKYKDAVKYVNIMGKTDKYTGENEYIHMLLLRGFRNKHHNEIQKQMES